MAAILKLLFRNFYGLFGDGTISYLFFRALKTIIMPNFILLTGSEQLKHISALLSAEMGILLSWMAGTEWPGENHHQFNKTAENVRHVFLLLK